MDLFSSPIGRLAFLGRHIIMLVLAFISGLLLTVVSDHQSGAILILLSQVPFWVGILYFTVFGVFPRLASIGLSRWFTLVFLVPVANIAFLIFLLFCPARWLIRKDEVA